MYPWLSAPFLQLQALVWSGQLGHALLLKGGEGMGKGELAKELSRALLCQHTDVAPCEHCHACRLHAAGSHPDLHVIGGEERSIGIDAIRGLGQVLAESARLGHGKVAVIIGAERMTEAAANALLKTLEEPAGEATLVLTSSRPERLLPTIRSRCQQWLLPLPAPAMVLDWLAGEGLAGSQAALNLNQGSPLHTRDYLARGEDRQRQQLLEQFVALAGQPGPGIAALQSALLERPARLHWLHLLLQDALQLALEVQAPLRLDDAEPLSRRLSRLGPAALDATLAALVELRRTLQPAAGRPLNAGLQLGLWLGRWTRPAVAYHQTTHSGDGFAG